MCGWSYGGLSSLQSVDLPLDLWSVECMISRPKGFAHVRSNQRRRLFELRMTGMYQKYALQQRRHEIADSLRDRKGGSDAAYRGTKV